MADTPEGYECLNNDEAIPIPMLVIGAFTTYVIMLIFFEFGGTKKNSNGNSKPNHAKSISTDVHNNDDKDAAQRVPMKGNAGAQSASNIEMESADDDNDANERNEEKMAIVNTNNNNEKKNTVQASSENDKKIKNSVGFMGNKKIKFPKSTTNVFFVRHVEWERFTYFAPICNCLNDTAKHYITLFLFIIQIVLLFVIFVYDIVRMENHLSYKSDWTNYECYARILLLSTNLKTSLCIFFAFLTKVLIIGKTKLHMLPTLLMFFSILFSSIYIPIFVTHIIPGVVCYIWLWLLLLIFLWFLWASWGLVVKLADSDIDQVAQDLVYLVLLTIFILITVTAIYLMAKLMNHLYGGVEYMNSLDEAVTQTTPNNYFDGDGVEYVWRRISLFL